MQAQPEERPGSAAEFARALRDFLRHRAASDLVATARSRLEDFERALDAPDPDDAQVHRLFTEARFGLRHALQEWPEHDAARGALERATERMVRFELRSGHPHSAAVLLADLDPQPAQLAAEVAAAQQSKATHEARAAHAIRQLDPGVERRARRITVVGVGVGFTLAPIVGPAVGGWSLEGSTYPNKVITASVLIAIVAGLTYLFRSRVFSSAFNRTTMGLLFLAPVGQLVFALCGWFGGLHLLDVTLLHFLWWGGVAAAGAVAVDWRLMVCTVGYVMGFVGAVLAPPMLYPIMVATNLVFTANALWIWSGWEDA